MRQVSGTEGYAQITERFIELSEAVDFTELHKSIIEFMPSTGWVAGESGEYLLRPCEKWISGTVVAVKNQIDTAVYYLTIYSNSYRQRYVA